ncbi:hydrolase [Lithospermum erythrorhizon]|uniref:Chromosome transmission fidelity protein 18 homolog n=1 Tax=Lithospermum erythrorhizon TaxID=34254 RepID=A0AAV3PZ34_LITER
MDMEIPDPEELQWLESNAFSFPDEPQFEELYDYPDSPLQDQQFGPHEVLQNQPKTQQHFDSIGVNKIVKGDDRPIGFQENAAESSKRSRVNVVGEDDGQIGFLENVESSKRIKIDVIDENEGLIGFFDNEKSGKRSKINVVDENEGLIGGFDSVVSSKRSKINVVGEDEGESGGFESVESSKRSRVNVGEGEDEEWLRYSPPRVVEDEVEVVEEVKEKILSRFATEIEGDCVPITGFDGERVYAKIGGFRAEEGVRVNRKLDVKFGSKGLISDPIRVLMQRVEQEELSKALKESTEEQNDSVPRHEPVEHEQLWVDKYSPSSFTELLSDEQTNREVLMWLKQWDSCVFGSEIKSTTDDVLSSLRRHSSGVQQSKLSGRSSFRSNRENRFGKGTPRDQNNHGSKDVQEPWDTKRKQSGPPEQKILLLCGPPGLGKTTLAHIAASHCGYRVVEINASDDRATSTVEAKILDVVQMNSVTTDSKPKCLVIDEIDGALNDGKGAVEVILKMVSASKTSATGKENAKRDGNPVLKSSRKKQGHTSLLRPIICICNDLYAPALRQLRQVAKVYVFVQPTVSRVVNRLKYICNKEGAKTSSTALTALAQYTECDIRSCLNTLQFLHKKKEALNLLEVSSQVVGRKDTSKSAFDVWKEIFQKRKSKQSRKSNCGPSGVFSDFEFLHTLISSCGDYDLILDGVHENMLQLRYHDPLMQKTVQCADGLGISDIVHQYIMRSQKMFLLAYQPPIAISIHNLVAQVEKPNIEWPKSSQRFRITLTERMDTFSSWHNRISPSISRHISTTSFVQESVSPLLHILSPKTLRPVTQHLLSEKEKIDMAELVDTMVSYSVTYKNMKSDPVHPILGHQESMDSSQLSLDPPISEFTNFKEYNSCYFVLASAVKQLLLHEVEKQKIMQSSRYKSVTDTYGNGPHALAGNHSGNKVSSKSHPTVLAAQKNSGIGNSTKKQLISSTSLGGISTVFSGGSSMKVKPQETFKKPSSTALSFFDRFKASSKCSQNTSSAVNKTATMSEDSRPLLFKFNEGYTNAVRRPVRIREFLL